MEFLLPKSCRENHSQSGFELFESYSLKILRSGCPLFGKTALKIMQYLIYSIMI